MKAELYWIPGPWRGKLAVAPRPRGGDWLNDEISSWKQAGVNTVLSTLTPEEEEDLDLMKESSGVEGYGMAFHSVPIPDRQVPPSPAAIQAAIGGLEQELLGGQTVLVHCRQGIGRSGLVAGCLLIRNGIGFDKALRILSTARGVPVPETEEQIRWLKHYSQIICALSP